jgi:hypothetical protein
MGLLDAVKNRVSVAVDQLSKTAGAAVEQVEAKAARVGHAAQSAFEPKPSAPAARPQVAVTGNPTVSAKALALNPALLKNDLTVAANGGAPPTTDAAAQAKALIAKHTSKLGNLYEENLGNELKELAKKDPVAAAEVLNEVTKQLGSSDVDDVAVPFSKLDDKQLRQLAETKAGREALGRMKAELESGVPDEDDKAAAFKLGQALTDAEKPEFRSERVEVRAKEAYGKTGHQSFDLNDVEQRKQLIVNSPQLDNLDSTTTDATRCAGAAVLNGMILAGDPKANAEAIERAAAKVNVQPGISAEERSALDAMKRGTMTPTDAAHLQELLVRSAKTPRPDDASRPLFTRGGPGGVTPNGMADFAQLLRREGAFANAKSVTFHAESAHWTVSVTDKAGVTTGANSFPGENGKGSLEKMPGTANFTELTITNLDDGNVKYGAKGSLFLPGVGELRLPEMETTPRPVTSTVDFPDLLMDFSTQMANDPQLMQRLLRQQGLAVP